jgi:hypothetical protein
MSFKSLLLALVLVVTGCHLGDPSAANPMAGLVLRTYDVPAGQAQRLRSALKEVLWFGSDGKDSNKWVGRVDVGPDGRLIVLASESVHEGVKALVASVAANPVKEAESVTLTYWIVNATPGQEGQTMPAELEPALAEVKKTEGPQGFSLVEKLSVTSLSGERGMVNGRDTSVDQFVTNTAGSLVADLRLERSGQRINTRVRLAPGKTVVLASSGAPAKDANEPVRSVLFIVKATPSGGDGR